MKYKILGRSGLRVSELCLGAMTFGNGGSDATPEEAKKIYYLYRDAGGNFIDTANIYTSGVSEEQVGRLVGKERQKIVLASKYSMTTDSSDPNASGNHRKNMSQSIERSLKRLKTDYLDLYWVHGWDQSTPIDEVMRALDDLIRTGKVLHIGVSNCPAWLISQANTIAKERNMTSFTALQLHYNLTDRSIENDFFDLAQEYGMSITAWSPLAGGLLSGKYNSNPETKGRLNNVSYGSRLLAEDRIKLAQEVNSIADRIGCETSALALAWLLQRPQGSVIPILGARTLDQLKANLTCLDLKLNETDVEKMDKLNPPPAVYPSSLFRSSFFNQLMHGEYGLIDS